MPVTLTIKGVPDAVAESLRRRAQSRRRSLQQELLLIAEEAAGLRVAEPLAIYEVAAAATSRARKSPAKAAPAAATGRLSLQQLWERAQRLGATMPGESADIVRRDRDARHGR
ncbi:MAG: hypothetical protein QM601_03255 [Pseudoxanthomonas sp.]